MDELKDHVRCSNWFSKIDLKNGYHLIRIKRGDEWKTAFRCRYASGLFEYTVMPFGLVNTPATFQSMMNHIIRDMVDKGMIAFMDDIIAQGKTRDAHDKIVLEVLKELRNNRLCIAPDKCEWAQLQVEFLGYTVSGQGLEMTDEKIQTLKEIEPVNSLKEVQHFLGFVNFYCRFVQDYSKMVLPLTNSTALSTKDWTRTPEIEAAQQHLITAFTKAPVLKHFDLDLPAIVETNTSHFALGAILSQKHKGRTHPAAFHSRTFTQAEINYDIADKELLSTVDSFKRWRRFLEVGNHQVQVIMDHQNVELFQTTMVLNRRQARWAQKLAGYDFRIFIHPGQQNFKADYLSRRPEHLLEKGGDRKPETILRPENITLYNEHTTHLTS